MNIECRITDRREDILDAERVIFPGVGAAGKAMETIRSLGLDQVMQEVIQRGTPFLGICLGTQIILESSDEDNARCLGFIPGRVRRFAAMPEKIPHMGWNNLDIVRGHPILEGIDPDAQFYFVHSYYAEPEEKDSIVASTTYGIEFASVIAKGSIAATQFHPEKSGSSGLRILENFSRWDGSV